LSPAVPLPRWKVQDFLTGFTFGWLRIRFISGKKDAKIGGVQMRGEGLLFDGQSGRFFHVYSEKGKVVIEKQPCRHEHSITAVAGV
jgi:hypothetical protein